MPTERDSNSGDQEDVLFIDGDLAYTHLMLEFDFEVDGSYREIWWWSKSDSALAELFEALERLSSSWRVDGLGHPTEEEYRTSPNSSPAIKIQLPGGIELHAYYRGSGGGEDIEANIDPKEITAENCRHVFNFMRNVGKLLAVDVYIGGESRDTSSPAVPGNGAFIRYDARADALRRLIPPHELIPPVKLFGWSMREKNENH